MRMAVEIDPVAEVASSAVDTAVRACEEAGLMIREKLGAKVEATKFNSKDLVTEVDVACQKIIEKYVEDEWGYMGHELLGEENVPPGKEESTKALNNMLEKNWLWVVDPIDGTTNFVMGMPLSAISIGIAYKGEVVGGVIYDPFSDEMFTAIKGRGAFVNNQPISVGNQEILDEAVVCAGSPPNPLSLAPSLRGIQALTPKIRTLRMLGSAAIMFAWVACGRITAYFEPDLNSWDIAAGAILIQEAGGCISDLDGTPYKLTTRAILASNGHTHNAILDVLTEADAISCDDDSDDLVS
mmetsp:Transcript_1721/g.2183  ORF Transcript_1721/g.2183 Transcript_1721/m.2183 type:complete len:297 (+) Transcript_1721:204-1094(+)